MSSNQSRRQRGFSSPQVDFTVYAFIKTLQGAQTTADFRNLYFGMLKMVSFITLTFLSFLGNLIIQHIFSTLEPKTYQSRDLKNQRWSRHPIRFLKKHMPINPQGGRFTPASSWTTLGVSANGEGQGVKRWCTFFITLQSNDSE